MTVDALWTYFSQEQLEQYQACEDDASAISLLADCLKLPEYRFDARQAVRLDYASYVLQFAKEQLFGPERTASLFSVAQNVLAVCTSGASMADAQASLKVELVGLTRAKPGLDAPYFAAEQVARIGKFFAGTLFTHYSLYQYCFTHEQSLTKYTADVLVETAMIPSLQEAIPEEEHLENLEQARLDAEAAAVAEAEAEAARQEEEQAAAQAAAQEAAEAARRAELEKKPATLEEAVAQMVALRLEEEKVALAEQYQAREQDLLTKISALEASVPAAAPEKERKPSAKGKK